MCIKKKPSTILRSGSTNVTYILYTIALYEIGRAPCLHTINCLNSDVSLVNKLTKN